MPAYSIDNQPAGIYSLDNPTGAGTGYFSPNITFPTSTTMNGSASTTSTNQSGLESLIPNYNNLVTKATGAIGGLLGGNQSPGITQNQAATWAAITGQPSNSGIVGRYGYDLYGQQANQRQQQGLQDFNQLIPTISSSESQIGNLSNQQFMDEINALIGLSDAGFGGTGGTAKPSTGSPSIYTPQPFNAQPQPSSSGSGGYVPFNSQYAML